MREEHLTFVADYSLLTTTLSLSWNMVHRDIIETGIPFSIGDNDIKSSFQINNRLELLLSGGANPFLSEYTEALKSNITLPATNGSNCNLRRLHILCSIILTPAHHLTAFLENHYRDMERFRSEFFTYVMEQPHLSPEKGIYHLNRLSTEISDYFKDQYRSPSLIYLPEPF